MGTERLNQLLTFIAIVAFAVAAAEPARAQSAGEISNAPFSKAPYRVGERLTYNVSFSAFPSAAHLELWIAGYGTYFNRQGIQLHAHAETTGVVNAALFSVNSDYVAFVAPDTGQPYRTQIVRREAGHTDDILSEEDKPAGNEAIPQKLQTGGFAGTLDIASALYRVRALPLTVGSSYSLVLRVNDVSYEVVLKVKGRTMIKTNVGSFNTVITQLHFPRDSSLDAYKIQINFSDDERHVPIFASARHPAGEIRAELAGSELPGATPPPVDTTQPDVAASQPQVQPAPNPSTDSPSGIPGIPGIPNAPTTVKPGDPNTASPVNPITPNATSPGRPGTRGVAPPLTAPSTSSTSLPAGLPFKAGEQLNFNIYLENIAQPVGLASFQVRARSQYFGRDGLMLTGKAQTVGTAQTSLSADDQITTYVDPNTLLPFRFEMNLQESRRQSSQTVVLDQDRGNATTETGTRLEIPVGTYDLLSAFYALRSFNLKSTKPNAISLLFNNRALTLTITLIKRETIELGGQQIPALQLSLTTDDAQPDQIGFRLWVSEDQRRLPLRLTVTTPSGKVRADLAILPIVRQ